MNLFGAEREGSPSTGVTRRCRARPQYSRCGRLECHQNLRREPQSDAQLPPTTRTKGSCGSKVRALAVLLDDCVSTLEVPRSPQRMVPGCGHAYEQIVASMVVARFPVGSDATSRHWRLTRKIDAAIAFGLAIAESTREDDSTSVYENRGFLFWAERSSSSPSNTASSITSATVRRCDSMPIARSPLNGRISLPSASTSRCTHL